MVGRYSLGRHSPRDFGPVALGRLETQAWASYRRREGGPALRARVGMVGQGFGLGPRLTLGGAIHDAAGRRAEAMGPSDAWGADRCHVADLPLAAERRGLVASHCALLDVVSGTPAETPRA